jgi:hypothetical protein
LEIDRIVIFKKGIEVSKEQFVVEMSYNNRGFFISCFGLEDDNKTFVLEISDPIKANYILDCFSHNYD